jgi:hypothetical protein
LRKRRPNSSGIAKVIFMMWWYHTRVFVSSAT